MSKIVGLMMPVILPCNSLVIIVFLSFLNLTSLLILSVSLSERFYQKDPGHVKQKNWE